MIKSVIAGAVAMAVVSFGVNAALTTPQGQGRVTFNGTVVDAPCSISQKSADQSIDFGQLSKSFLQAGGVSKPMNLDIELVNCDITSFKGGGGVSAAKKGTVKLAFSGPRVSGHNEELDTSGGTGTAIVVQAAGKNVSFDGTEGDANTLKMVIMCCIILRLLRSRQPIMPKSLRVLFLQSQPVMLPTY